MTNGVLLRTALYAEHLALGGRMVPFAGFDMPVQYAGILKEHDAVRNRAGLFDLSHMAQFTLRGSGVGAWADALTVNNVATMKPWQARYNIFTNQGGGCRDDVLFYRLDGEKWLLVVNASNARKMWEYLNDQRAPEVKVMNRHDERALLAVQGPRAIDILQTLVEPTERAALRAMKYYTCARSVIAGVPTLLARTGYTGEDGFELFIGNADAVHIWRRLLENGAACGLEPTGLGARDILRLEAGMPLYGFELAEDLSPIAGGQRWAVKMEKPEFIGKQALAQQVAQDTYDRIVAIVLPGRVPARTGYPVFHGEERIGEVRSASFAPSLRMNVATALVRKGAASVGTDLHVEIRGTRHDARVVTLPFYQRIPQMS